ncbi:succinate--CoA ligase subunit beta [Candidatus Rickettsiella isopodorum]|jgi:succinyl-CoA synthetase beta subunit|uniref:Succinate--CoA ligase [ADP-forming] subunit beta n=1 Tax=Candidatus Rickettsiella isopodorum TaxID=1225476 RepID=A0A1J8P7T2_9COXI|nr:ADP-forming succinate--CoA ligase subunit beta [Candidatus Rickettsiella isopodorum]OIZ95059.1 succinate--CoA ligase subunit beta [Candidatus Rickettsiella isopodorum]
MNLHEYQGKELFSEYGLPIPLGKPASTVEEALAAAEALGGNAWMVKAQVHAGGRGKAGGVKYVTSKEAVVAESKRLLGRRLVTFQTDEQGQPVSQVLIAQPCDIKRELYLGAVLDRSTRRVVIMASTEGGVEIEKVAEETPEKILKITMDPLLGVMPYQARDIGFKLQLTPNQLKEFTQILLGLGKMFVERDLSLVEINPLIIDKNDQLICLDAKVVVDDNALFRQAQLRAMRDPSQEDERENRAHDWELNYIALDGDIGCMVNGAGLAMATMDLIKLHGGNPANFLDVGGGATQERVTEAFKIILSDEKVKGILVNIFGGIVRCDMIADGIIGAVKDVGVKIPVVVRLEGNNAAVGAKKLSESGLNIIAANSLTGAAEQIVAAVKSPIIA